MKHNIIAILVFIGFIATVFTLGYITSRDTMPMYRGHIPNISTAGGQSVDRHSGGDGLSVSQISNTPMRHAVSGYHAHSESYSSGSNSSSGSGVTLSSSSTLHSYGGGMSVGGTANRSSANRGMVSTGTSSGVRMPSLAFSNRRNESNNFGEQQYGLASGYRSPVLELALGDGDDDDPDKPGGSGGHNEDPFSTPVGNVPIALIITMIGAYIAIKTLRLKHD